MGVQPEMILKRKQSGNKLTWAFSGATLGSRVKKGLDLVFSTKP